MKIIGTHDEITYIMLQCQKKKHSQCEECVLYHFCKPEMFMRMKPAILNAIEAGKCKPILISKGDDENVNQV